MPGPSRSSSFGTRCSLSAELDRAGFVRVTRREAGESDDPAFRNLERRLGETEAATSLIVEAWRAG